MPTINIQGNNAGWTDSGITLAPGDTLQVLASGLIYWSGGDENKFSFPEGYYPPDAEELGEPITDRPQEIDKVSGYGENDLESASEWAVTNTKPFSLAMVFRPVGTTPSSEKSAVADAFYVTRSGSWQNGDDEPMQVWFIFNELAALEGAWDNNSGSFTLHLEKIGLSDGEEESTCDHAIGRYMTTGLEKEFRLPMSDYVYMWAIEPEGKPAEGYTSSDQSFEFPAVLDKAGNEMVPALLYLDEGGVVPTELPNQTGMSDDTIDIMKGLPRNSDLRRRLTSEYYRNATATILAAVPEKPNLGAVILFSGKIGKAKIDDLSATFELHPWSNQLQQPMLRVISPLCDCELFMRGRCAGNGEDPSAPQTTDEGRILTGTIIAVTDAATFTTDIIGQDPSWGTFGRASFSDGQNEFVPPRPIKQWFEDGRCVLHNELPYIPEVGDTVVVEEGCARTWDACKQKQNTNNFQGFPFVPGRQNLVKRYGQ